MERKLLNLTLPFFRATRRLITASRKNLGKRMILLSSMPKSGSTFISNKISGFADIKKVHFLPTYGRREQEIEEIHIWKNLLLHYSYNQIAQHHTRCSDHTVKLINRYNIQPIVCLRGIKDSLVSLCDHWNNENLVSYEYFLNESIISSLNPLTTKLELSVILAGPWLLNFFLTWKSNQKYISPSLKPIYINYDKFFSDTSFHLSQILDQLEIKKSKIEVDEILKTKSHDRFNMGIQGRGREAFENDPVAKHALDRLLNIYSNEEISEINY